MLNFGCNYHFQYWCYIDVCWNVLNWVAAHISGGGGWVGKEQEVEVVRKGIKSGGA